MNTGTSNVNPMSAMRRPQPRADAFTLRRRHVVSDARVIAAFDAVLAASSVNIRSATLRAHASRLPTRPRAVQSP